ncbi:MAG: hypothetical protein ACNI23_12330 [Maridesulfovibrio sp.]
MKFLNPKQTIPDIQNSLKSSKPDAATPQTLAALNANKTLK